MTEDMSTATETRIGWWFCAGEMRDGRPIPADGETLRHDGDLNPCHSGLHASARCIDALQFAPGHTLCRVESRGECVEHGDPVDKYVSHERVILQRIDARPLLRAWARWCALQVIDKWDAPDVVREYLATGDDGKRAAARAAAWAAARAAARAAAWDTARVAAWDAARAAAWDAARAAAWDAAIQRMSRRLTAMIAAERRA